MSIEPTFPGAISSWPSSAFPKRQKPETLNPKNLTYLLKKDYFHTSIHEETRLETWEKCDETCTLLKSKIYVPSLLAAGAVGVGKKRKKKKEPTTTITPALLHLVKTERNNNSE